MSRNYEHLSKEMSDRIRYDREHGIRPDFAADGNLAVRRDMKSDRESAIAPYIAAAEEARKCGLGLNAGHDLSLENLEYFAQQIPWCDEVSIGHALISDALYYGLENTVQLYRRCLK